MKVLVMIPAYNEQKSIKNVVNELKENYSDFDYIVLNDCSVDGTEAVCHENNYNYLSLPINLGIGGNVQTGYRYAKKYNYDIAIQMDGDGQHDPSYLNKLIKPIENNNADIVIGSRFINKAGFQTSFSRRMGILFFSWLLKICCGRKITDATSGFRACSKKLISFYSDNYAQDYPEPEAVVAAIRNGFRLVEIPVMMKERQTGVSSINLFKSVYYMIKVSLAIILNLVKPIQKTKE